MLFQSIPSKLLCDLYFIEYFFFIFGKHLSVEKNNGEGKGGKYSESENSRRKKRKCLKNGKNVRFAGENITDKEKKENIWV